MKSYYFLQRSRPKTTKRQRRGLAITILLVAVLFAVVMHLPKASPVQLSTVSTKPRTTPAIAIPSFNTTTVNQAMPYGTSTVNSPTLPQGVRKITTIGVPGIWTITYQQTTINGKVMPKHVVSVVTTKDPVNEVVTVGTGSTATN